MAWPGGGLVWCVAVAALCGMTILHTGAASGQEVAPQGPEAEEVTPQTPVEEKASPPTPKRDGGIPSTQKAKREGREPETNIIPSLRLSERYDSNVFFVPGTNLEDYVTTVSPQVRVVHRRQLVEATVGGGVTAEAYVKNPGLNYVAANGSVDLNLDGAMNELVRGLGLRISDTFYYTPQAPSFVAPTGGSEVPDSFVRGIQAQRANSRSNAGRVDASYSISPVLDIISTYKDQRIQFGNAISAPTAGVPASFIDTTFQTVTSGPVLKVSPLDTVRLSHLYQKGTFSIGGSTSSFSTQGAMAGWTRSFSPTLTASLEGGVTVLSTGNDLQPLAAASLEWKRRDTDVTLSYSRVIVPSFYFLNTPLLSQVVSGTVTHRLSESLSVLLNGNYAINQSVPDSSLLKFESYSVTPSVSYKVNRIMTATVSYTRSQFQQTFSSQEFRFDRNMVLLSLFAEWK